MVASSWLSGKSADPTTMLPEEDFGASSARGSPPPEQADSVRAVVAAMAARVRAERVLMAVLWSGVQEWSEGTG